MYAISHPKARINQSVDQRFISGWSAPFIMQPLTWSCLIESLIRQAEQSDDPNQALISLKLMTELLRSIESIKWYRYIWFDLMVSLMILVVDSARHAQSINHIFFDQYDGTMTALHWWSSQSINWIINQSVNSTSQSDRSLWMPQLLGKRPVLKSSTSHVTHDNSCDQTTNILRFAQQ